MKNPLSKRRLAVALATAAICGASFAAVSPISLPWQGVSPKLEQHDQILAGVGSYEGTLTMSAPGMPKPMKTPCHEVVTSIGELWTTSRFETSFMGMPFVGSSTLGYDPAKGKYVGTWIDSTSTSITFMEGDFDKDKNAIVMEYEAFDPPTGRSKKMRSEMAVTDDGYTMTFFTLDGDQASKQMEMVMTRKAMDKDAADK